MLLMNLQILRHCLLVWVLVAAGEEAKKGRWEDALLEAGSVLELISQRYEYQYPPSSTPSVGKAFMLMQSNLREDDFNHLKYSLALKMLSEGEMASYKMIFGGSSVTAGHDNMFHDSYPQIVEQRLHEVFRLAGIDLDVRNIAQGANPCLPYDMCYAPMGGHKADFYSWEQSFNCGRNAESMCFVKPLLRELSIIMR